LSSPLSLTCNFSSLGPVTPSFEFFRVRRQGISSLIPGHGPGLNSWMIFYQQSATVDKEIGPEMYGAARWGIGIGAVLTQP